MHGAFMRRLVLRSICTAGIALVPRRPRLHEPRLEPKRGGSKSPKFKSEPTHACTAVPYPIRNETHAII